MDVNLIPWTQDGVAGCYMKFQDDNGDPTGTLWKLEGCNSFDTSRNVTERKLAGDNATYIKNSKFDEYGLNVNFYGLIFDLLGVFLPGTGDTDGDVSTFDEDSSGQPRKIVLYQVSDAVGKNGETGQTLETFHNCQVTNLTNPKQSGELVTWQAQISGLNKSGTTNPRSWKFVKGGVALVTSGTDTAPVVSSTTPAQGATSVNVNTNITVVFDVNVDEASLAHVTLEKLSNGVAHNIGTPAYDDGTFTAVWDPATNLSSASEYLLTIPGNKVKKPNGAYLAADVHRTFTTA